MKGLFIQDNDGPRELRDIPGIWEMGGRIFLPKYVELDGKSFVLLRDDPDDVVYLEKSIKERTSARSDY